MTSRLPCDRHAWACRVPWRDRAALMGRWALRMPDSLGRLGTSLTEPVPSERAAQPNPGGIDQPAGKRRHSNALRSNLQEMKARIVAAVGVLGLAWVLASCGSSSSSSNTTATTHAASSQTTVPSQSTTTTSVATTSAATCPTLAQAVSALGASYASLVQHAAAGGSIVCEYTGGPSGNAGVTIFAHQSQPVFTGQVAHATGAPAMPALSGVGDGAYGADIGGHSVVNAYSNATRTLVAAQATGSLASVEALAKVALSDN